MADRIIIPEAEYDALWKVVTLAKRLMKKPMPPRGLAAALENLDVTKVCPECKGKKGYRAAGYPGTGAHKGWHDCHPCDGTGIIQHTKDPFEVRKHNRRQGDRGKPMRGV